MNNIGVILFDIDGVIRSVENSYRLSLKKTVYQFCGWEPSYQDIDMLSIIIIGNSKTTLVDDIFLTPRGYL